MKILVTGAAGFLGSYLVEHFLKEGHTVIGVDNLIGGNLDNLSFATKNKRYQNNNPYLSFFSNDYKFYFRDCDCRDWRTMDDLMAGRYGFEKIHGQKDPVDLVYHCAATAHEGLSVFSPSFITKNIFEASVSVISAAIANKVKRFIFCSSMARYGNGYSQVIGDSIQDGLIYQKREAPFKEYYQPNPVDPYGIAKVAAENVLRVLSEENGMEYIVAVPHNIVGVRQNYTDPYRNVASIMMNRVKQGLPINVYGDGQQTRCFSPIDDCLTCLVKLADIDYDTVKEKFGINHSINIGPDKNPITINQLASWSGYGQFTGFDHLPDRPLEVKHATCSSELARKLLNYKEVKSLNDCLKEMWDAIPSGGVPFKYEYPIEIINERTPKPFLKKTT